VKYCIGLLPARTSHPDILLHKAISEQPSANSLQYEVCGQIRRDGDRMVWNAAVQGLRYIWTWSLSI